MGMRPSQGVGRHYVKMEGVSRSYQVPFVDSSTGGEPTRVFFEGFPDLGNGSLQDRAARLGQDHKRFSIESVSEPRGNEAMVGAIIVPPQGSKACAGVIFFNPSGPLGMCGHGTIGVVETLLRASSLGISIPDGFKLDPETSALCLETPVGEVSIQVGADRQVAVENVPAYRHLADVVVQLDSGEIVAGDVAYGGNWFFLAKESPIPVVPANIRLMEDFTLRVRAALARDGITGADGHEIDHIELFGPPLNKTARSKNFVMCPSGAYDRSPCGTGTCAKAACLAADGKLAPGETWVQESITGSLFTVSYRPGQGNSVIPTVAGSAEITEFGTLILRND